jgi:MFS transporter, OFA family, oxalate/formate antiporter
MSANASIAAPRGWYHGWNIVAVCILSQAVGNGLTYNALSLFLKGWSQELHTPISRLTLTVAIMGTAAAFFSPFVGALADKYPARRLLVGGLLGMALFYVCVGSVTASWQLLVLYGVLAAPALTFCTAVVANALISRWFVRRRGLAFGLSAFGIGLAGVLLPQIINPLLPIVGWRMIWWGGGVFVAVVVVPIILVVVRNRPSEEEGRYYLTGETASAGHHGHGAGGGTQMSWREVIKRKNFWLLVGIYLPLVALSGAAVQNIVPYASSHGLSRQAGAALLSLLSAMHVIATVVLGLLSDRFGNRLPFIGLAVLMVVGALLLALGSDLPIIILGCFFIGLGSGVFTLLAAAIAVEFGAEGMGRAFGMCMMFVPVITLAPYLIARSQEETGSYTHAFIGGAIFLAMSGFLATLYRERRGSSTTWVEPQAEVPANPL